MTSKNNRDGNQDPMGQANIQFGGVLDGMANLIGKLGELAEKGQELKKSGQFESDDGETVAGSYGFSVKFGPGGNRDDEMKVQPVQTGNRQKAAAPKTESREPHVDVFNEKDHVLVVAEMPGVAVEQVEINFAATRMTLVGNSPRIRFEKEVELGRTFQPSDVTTAINNGIVEIKLSLDSSESAEG